MSNRNFRQTAFEKFGLGGRPGGSRWGRKTRETPYPFRNNSFVKSFEASRGFKPSTSGATVRATGSIKSPTSKRSSGRIVDPREIKKIKASPKHILDPRDAIKVAITSPQVKLIDLTVTTPKNSSTNNFNEIKSINSTSTTNFSALNLPDESAPPVPTRPTVTKFDPFADRKKTTVTFPRFDLLSNQDTPKSNGLSCFLCEITTVAPPKVFVTDVKGEERVLVFGSDCHFSGEGSGAFGQVMAFKWGDIQAGFCLAIVNAKKTRLNSGITGICISKEELGNLFVFSESLVSVCTLVLKLSSVRVTCFFGECSEADKDRLEKCDGCGTAVFCCAVHRRKHSQQEGHISLCPQVGVLTRLLGGDGSQGRFSFVNLE